MKKYLSLIKFSHTIFALPFAIIGFFLSYPESNISYLTFIYVMMCMVFARSAAMAFNRYIDRDIDTINPRTSEIREIPSKKIKPSAALKFVILNSILFIITTYLINQICLVKHYDLKKVNIAFFTTNGIASIVFGFFVILDILI